MIYTDLTKKAIKLMFEAHKDQTDKSGKRELLPWYTLPSNHLPLRTVYFKLGKQAPEANAFRRFFFCANRICPIACQIFAVVVQSEKPT